MTPEDSGGPSNSSVRDRQALLTSAQEYFAHACRVLAPTGNILRSGHLLGEASTFVAEVSSLLTKCSDDLRSQPDFGPMENLPEFPPPIGAPLRKARVYYDEAMYYLDSAQPNIENGADQNLAKASQLVIAANKALANCLCQLREAMDPGTSKGHDGAAWPDLRGPGGQS